MISFDQVSKQFDGRTVVKTVSFKIDEGEVVGLLGPNGAGKTTTLRMITGVLPPTRGRVTIDGKNPIDESSIRSSVGYLPENNPIYEDMTVEEWLRYWQQVKHAADEQELKEVVKRTGLESVYYRVISELSKGYRQRVGLAQAMLGNPKILVMDEPTDGLDPNQRGEIHTLIKELGRKRTVIISSHILSEITKMCNRVVILSQGQLVADGSPHELASESGGGQIVEAELVGTGVSTGLKSIKGVLDVTKDGNNYVLKVDGKKDVRLDIFEMAKKKDWKLYGLIRKQIELEEVFRELTK